MVKTYNPFKMWGSWMGLIILFLYGLLGELGGFGCEGSTLELLRKADSCRDYIAIALLIWMFTGFLVGWGIHSLIRKVKKI